MEWLRKDVFILIWLQFNSFLQKHLFLNFFVYFDEFEIKCNA